MANSDMCLKVARKVYPNNENLRVAYMLGFNDGFDKAKEQQEVDLEKEVKHYIKENFTITDEIQEIPEEDMMYGVDKGDILKIARYFYNLGFKTRKV